jgi:hypothetical protein
MYNILDVLVTTNGSGPASGRSGTEHHMTLDPIRLPLFEPSTPRAAIIQAAEQGQQQSFERIRILFPLLTMSLIHAVHQIPARQSSMIVDQTEEET